MFASHCGGVHGVGVPQFYQKRRPSNPSLPARRRADQGQPIREESPRLPIVGQVCQPRAPVYSDDASTGSLASASVTKHVAWRALGNLLYTRLLLQENPSRK